MKNFFVRNYVGSYNLWLKKRKGVRPLNIDFWKRRKEMLSKFSNKPDILLPSVGILKSKGSAIKVAPLREIFYEMTLGSWTLDAGTIELIWAILLQNRPMYILECGAGISTLVFCKYLQLYCPEGKIWSIEQSIEEKHRVEALLKKWDLSAFATILNIGVDAMGEYDFSSSAELTVMKEKIDLILVDGPAGPDRCRQNTLPALYKLAQPNARWLLDDSFRDGELQIIQDWAKDDHLTLDGIYPVGKGVATGKII